MEKQTKTLFYIGTENDKKNRLKPPGKALPVYRLARPLPYAQGSLQIYFCLLPAFFPEDSLKGVRTGKKRWSEKRQKKKWYAALSNAFDDAKADLQGGGFDFVVIAKQAEDLPEELFAVCLWEARRSRESDSISITLPGDCGRLKAEQVITLMEPYLSRINSVALVGEESENADFLEDYLYEEYGIPTSYEKYPLKNTVWIDLSEQENPIQVKYAKENRIYHLNKTEVMKFLDTTAKNGYNTKVN